MAAQPWFCRNADDFNALAERLKLTPCPHCRKVGTLIRHGYLRGYDDHTPPRPTVRARRLFCSNRRARRGCGRTFSVWYADTIRRLSLNTGTLWRFLQRAVASSLRAAIRAAPGPFSDRTWQRHWQRFQRAQCTIRTALAGRCPPPELPAEHQPAALTLAHLRAAFPNDPCPIAAFQQTLRTFFL